MERDLLTMQVGLMQQSGIAGNFTVSKCQALLLSSKYSNDHIGTISSVVGESKYDKLKIDEINNLVLDAGYADINIGTLTKKLEFTGGYGSLNVDRVPSGFESIKTDTHYMGVKVAIDEGASYKLEGYVRYGSRNSMKITSGTRDVSLKIIHLK